MTGTPIPNVPIPNGKGKYMAKTMSNNLTGEYQFPMGYQSPMGKV